MDNWLLPITIVPGIGLLILSTSNLMVTLSAEINGLKNNKPENEAIISRKLIQLKTLNRAMVFFYIAVACLATSGLLGGLELQMPVLNGINICISIIGILFMLLGLLFLIKYSYKAVTIRQDQFKTKFNKN